VLPSSSAGTTLPETAKKLSFILTNIEIDGEFTELAAKRRELTAPLLQKRITVADAFELANKLQQAYANAGYPLVRVVVPPQQLDNSAELKLSVVDGFFESINLDALPPAVHDRVFAALSKLIFKRHLTQHELEQRLLIAGETPGLILNSVASAGKSEGGSILVLTGKYRPASASVYVDDALPKAFGTWQIASTASLNNAFGFGDRLTVSFAGYPDKNYVSSLPTRRYLSSAFVAPIGVDGWTLELGGINGVTTPLVSPAVATQGVLDQAHVKMSYDVIKSRDLELTLNGRFEAANEMLNSLLLRSAVGINEDRTRVLRIGADGTWQLRGSETTINYGTNVSQGLNAFGARTAADANPLLPLSRQDADAVFTKLDAHFEVVQNLPYDFTASFNAFGQTSFHRALLTTEQIDITGAKMLSGFTTGALSGDSVWALRAEFGRSFRSSGLVFTPYIFGAAGERILEDPTALEIGSLRVASYGLGTRMDLAPWLPEMPDSSGFIEWGRNTASNLGSGLDSYRIFAGMLLKY
jgi:hemolysin activation/secretion protein